MSEPSSAYTPHPYRRVRAGENVPAGGLALTAAIDAQAHRLELKEVAWYEVTEDEINEAEETESGMQMLAYLLIALAVTAIAFTAAFVITAKR